jgi:sulfur-oxidizing protein SoxY
MTRQSIDSGRRRALRLLGTTAGVLGAILLVPLRVLAAEWNKAAFDATAVPDAIKAIGASDIAQSDGIELKAPEIAENGAIVPVEVTSRLPGTQSLWIIADKNPQPLVAEFTFTEATEPFVSTRIKMSESSRIRVIVKASGKFYETVRDVKVTIGGCGG